MAEENENIEVVRKPNLRMDLADIIFGTSCFHLLISFVNTYSSNKYFSESLCDPIVAESSLTMMGLVSAYVGIRRIYDSYNYINNDNKD